MITTLWVVIASPNAMGVTYPLNQTSPIGASVNEFAPGGYSRGYRFRPNAQVWVTQLGMVVPSGSLGRQISLKLWNFSSEEQIASATLQANGNETWQWANLTSAVTLTANTDYVVTLSSALGPWAYYFSGNSNFLPAGLISFVEMRFSNSGDVFPSGALQGSNFGFADIGYESTPPPQSPTPAPSPSPPSPPSDAVPTPISGSTLLSLFGLLAAGGTWTFRRRRS